MSKIGTVATTPIFTFDNGFEYSFHTAMPDGRVFTSRMDTWPSITARERRINYKLLRNSTPEEIAAFIEGTSIIVTKVRAST